VAYLKEMVEMQANTPAPGAQGVDEKLLLANILRACRAPPHWRRTGTIASPTPAPNVETMLGLRVEDMAGTDLRDTLKALGWSAAPHH